MGAVMHGGSGGRKHPAPASPGCDRGHRWLFPIGDASGCSRGNTEAFVRNLITDVAGLKVGHADDAALGSASTAIVFDEPAVASVDLRGGGPGTRETELLAAETTVEHVDAITLSGGSAFGLDAASGVQARLREQGRGFAVGPARVPIVPGAIVFDLLAGGNKNWGRFSALSRAWLSGGRCCFAGFRTWQRRRRHGGHGGQPERRYRLGIGDHGRRPHRRRAGDRERSRQRHHRRRRAFLGGAVRIRKRIRRSRLAAAIHAGRSCHSTPRAARGRRRPSRLLQPTPILTSAQTNRFAVMAQTGCARAIYPVHTPLDGDTVFAAATGRKPLADPLMSLTTPGLACSECPGTRDCTRCVMKQLPFPSTANPSMRVMAGQIRLKPDG